MTMMKKISKNRVKQVTSRLALKSANSLFQILFRALGGSPKTIASFAMRTNFGLLFNYTFLYLYASGYGALAVEILKKRGLNFVKPKYAYFAAEILLRHGQHEDAEAFMAIYFDEYRKNKKLNLASNALKWYSKRSSLPYAERRMRIDELCAFLSTCAADGNDARVQIAVAHMHFARSTFTDYQWISLLPWPTESKREILAMSRLSDEISREGYSDTARKILERAKSLDKRFYDLNMLRSFPMELDISSVEVPETPYGRLRFLTELRDVRNFSEKHNDLFRLVVAKLCDDYNDVTSPEREAILRLFISANLHEQATVLLNSSKIGWANHYSALVLRGWSAFERSDFQAARDCFIEAVYQNPGYNSARDGLRFSLARCGKNFQEIAETIKDITSSLRHYGGETTWLKLEQGDLKGYGEAVQGSPLWKALRNFSKGKYLENFSNIETQGKSILFVATWGIGDEIRQAWMYRYLLENFQIVHATCEPRLLEILRNTYPTIHFHPMSRPRRGVAEVASSAERLSGWGGLLREPLIEEIRPVFESVDFICGAYSIYASRDTIKLNDFTQSGFLQPLAPKIKSLDENRPLRVGILWRSHLLTGARKLMYLDHLSLNHLLGIEGVEFHSIQHKISDEELNFCHQSGIVVRSDIDLFSDFTGMADYFSTFDVVIGISTASTELAAAIGVPTWLIGFSPENYFMRTGGGRSGADILSTGTQVIGPKIVDFSRDPAVCIAETMQNIREKLEAKVLESAVHCNILRPSEVGVELKKGT